MAVLPLPELLNLVIVPLPVLVNQAVCPAYKKKISPALDTTTLF